MRRIVTAVLIGLLGLVTPAFAQSPAPPTGGTPGSLDGLLLQNNANPDLHSDGTSGNAEGSTDGTDTFAQAPPTISPFLIIGGIAGGAGLIAYAVSQNQSDDTPTSP